MKKLIATAVAATFAALALVGPASADVIQTEPADRLPVTSTYVTYAEMYQRVWPSLGTAPRNTLIVDFNTGSQYEFTACKYEDSNNCFWNAKKRGNGEGRSFVTLRNKTYTVPARFMPA